MDPPAPTWGFLGVLWEWCKAHPFYGCMNPEIISHDDGTATALIYPDPRCHKARHENPTIALARAIDRMPREETT